MKKLSIICALLTLSAVSLMGQQTVTFQNNQNHWTTQYLGTTAFSVVGGGELDIQQAYYVVSWYNVPGVKNESSCRNTGTSTSPDYTITINFACSDGVTGQSIQTQTVIAHVSCGGRAHRICAVYGDTGGFTTVTVQ
jgi:hypothetical protein